MMVARQDMTFGTEIEDVFREIEMPERYNDHSLGVRVFKVPSDGRPIIEVVESFVTQAEIAKKMVSKWFGRDKAIGCFNTALIQERGLYNATIPDASVAMQTVRGKALLADAGEKLIGRTFLLVNEYRYKKRFSSQKGASTSHLSDTILDVTNQAEMDAYREQLHEGGKILSEFTIYCTSYLFQLEWTEEEANLFYNKYFFSCTEPDTHKAANFKQDKNTFRMSYVGMCQNQLTEKNTQKLSSVKLVKKACVRIMDQNIAQLQHRYPAFRIKATLAETAPLKAYIGLKEDVTPDTKFEVLMPEMHEDGTYSYKRVGVIQPIAGKIWDNRYMIGEESLSELDATYFRQISGGTLHQGMLIREMD